MSAKGTAKPPFLVEENIKDNSGINPLDPLKFTTQSLPRAVAHACQLAQVAEGLPAEQQGICRSFYTFSRYDKRLTSKPGWLDELRHRLHRVREIIRSSMQSSQRDIITRSDH